jgi:hypothetical protein
MSNTDENNAGGGKTIRKMKENEKWPKYYKEEIKFHAKRRKMEGAKDGAIAIEIIQKGIAPNHPEKASEAFALGTDYWSNAMEPLVDAGMLDDGENLEDEHIVHLQTLDPVQRLNAFFMKKFDKHGTAALDGEGELQRMSRKGNQTYWQFCQAFKKKRDALVTAGVKPLDYTCVSAIKAGLDMDVDEMRRWKTAIKVVDVYHPTNNAGGKTKWADVWNYLEDMYSGEKKVGGAASKADKKPAAWTYDKDGDAEM